MTTSTDVVSEVTTTRATKMATRSTTATASGETVEGKKPRAVIDALNENNYLDARDLLLQKIAETVGDKRSWDSPQYTTHRRVQEALKLDTERNKLLTFFGLDTLRDRYFLRDFAGNICETPQDFWARVSTGIACGAMSADEVEAKFDETVSFARDLYEVTSQLWFIPATPVLTNIGTKRGLPISCYLNEIDDSIEDIFEVMRENAFLGKGGGGIGTYWGNLRGMNARLGTGGYSSGPIPFMKVSDSETLAVNQAGARRGAKAAYMQVSHPDIEEFIDIRRPQGDQNRRCLNIYNAVIVTDAFMEAVEAGSLWELRHPHNDEVARVVDARALWKKILTARVEIGTPYILFIDTVNRCQPACYKRRGLKVKMSNLCIEITLPTSAGSRLPTKWQTKIEKTLSEVLTKAGMAADAVKAASNDLISSLTSEGGRTAICDLGSVNLATYPSWQDRAEFVYYTAVKALDTVLDVFITHAGEGYEKAAYSASRGRDIGLGVMGWTDYLQQRGIALETIEARAHNKILFKQFGELSIKASERLGQERGIPEDCDDRRNANVSALAPTATIGSIAGASPSTEGWPGNTFSQKTLSGTFFIRNPNLERLLREKYPQHDNDDTWKSITAAEGSVQHLEWMDEHDRKVYKTAYEVNQREIVQQAADRQPWITQSQSLNLFFAPNSKGRISARYLHDTHMLAWKLGVKSLYYCRSASVLRAASVDAKRIQQVIDRIENEECTVCQ